jgi:hypothetical protein
MTGGSIPWRMNSEERLKFYKYCKKPISAALIMAGGGLMLEHLFEFGKFDLLDFWGHEYVGLGLIISGFLLSTDFSQWKSMDLKNIKNWFR